MYMYVCMYVCINVKEGWKVHMMSYLLLMTFLTDVIQALQHWQKRWATLQEELYWKNKGHLVTLHVNILVSLWTFSATYIYIYIIYIYIIDTQKETTPEDSMFAWESIYLVLEKYIYTSDDLRSSMLCVLIFLHNLFYV